MSFYSKHKKKLLAGLTAASFLIGGSHASSANPVEDALAYGRFQDPNCALEAQYVGRPFEVSMFGYPERRVRVGSYDAYRLMGQNPAVLYASNPYLPLWSESPAGPAVAMLCSGGDLAALGEVVSTAQTMGIPTYSLRGSVYLVPSQEERFFVEPWIVRIEPWRRGGLFVLPSHRHSTWDSRRDHQSPFSGHVYREPSHRQEVHRQEPRHEETRNVPQRRPELPQAKEPSQRPPQETPMPRGEKPHSVPPRRDSGAQRGGGAGMQPHQQPMDGGHRGERPSVPAQMGRDGPERNYGGHGGPRPER